VADHSCYASALEILRRTPNLRQLQYFHNYDEDWASVELTGIEKLSLRRLRRLEFCQLNDRNADFLKFLITGCGVQLDYFKYFSLTEPNYSEMIASLLTSVRFISIATLHDPSPRSAFNKMSVESRKFMLKEIYLTLMESEYGPAENLISIHAPHLEKLELSINVESGSRSIPFRFPVLPKLTFFGIDFLYDSQSSANFINIFLSILETSQFPVLHELNILEVDRTGGGKFTTVLFPSNCHFDSVSKLIFDSFSRVRDNWIQVFPNLTILDATINGDAEGVQRIFCYSQLKELTLHMQSEEGTNVDSLFSGILDPETAHKMSEEEIATERLIHGLPSILQLTSELEINKAGSNHGIFFSLHLSSLKA